MIAHYHNLACAVTTGILNSAPGCFSVPLTSGTKENVVRDQPCHYKLGFPWSSSVQASGKKPSAELGRYSHGGEVLAQSVRVEWIPALV